MFALGAKQDTSLKNIVLKKSNVIHLQATEYLRGINWSAVILPPNAKEERVQLVANSTKNSSFSDALHHLPQESKYDEVWVYKPLSTTRQGPNTW